MENYLGEVFINIRNMNSNFAVISTLVKSDISERCIINFLTNVSSRALRNYLECGNIYKGNYPKKESRSY